jgi:hypothetical protein
MPPPMMRIFLPERKGSGVASAMLWRERRLSSIEF